MGAKKKTKKKKGMISRQISLLTAVFMILIALITGISNTVTSKDLIESNNEDVLVSAASNNAKLLDDWLNSQATVITTMANSLAFAGNEEPQVLETYLSAQLPENSDALMYYVCSETNVYPADFSTIDLDPTTRSWWSACMEKGGIAYTEPYIDAVTGEMVVSISYPFKINGNQYVILADILLTTIENTLAAVSESDSSTSAFLLMADGTVITHPNEAYLPTADGSTNLNDVLNVDLASEDVTQFTDYNGQMSFMKTATVASSGWILGIVRNNSSVAQTLLWTQLNTLVILIAALVIFTIAVMLILKKVLAPVSQMAEAAENVSKGNFDLEIKHSNKKDEISVLQNSVASLIETLTSIIAETNRILGSLASYDLTTADMDSYPGEFNELSQSVNNVKHLLRDLLTNMYGAARSVDDGSSQFAQAAESLSAGATAQASSITQLEASMASMADRIDNNAKQCDVVNNKLVDLNEKIGEGNTEMQKLFDSVQEVEDMSADIQKIVSAIDNIAFQTNILALNAAVEAARAGENGKGFAVVAEEVRNLAGKSAEESAKTAELIQSCIESITNAKTHADTTLDCLSTVVSNSNEIAAAFDNISTDTLEQAKGAEEIRDALRNIADIVQTNTAASEETAASSQELASQAQALSGTVSRFRL